MGNIAVKMKFLPLLSLELGVATWQLTQILADCNGITEVFLIEGKPYKWKVTVVRKICICARWSICKFTIDMIWRFLVAAFIQYISVCLCLTLSDRSLRQKESLVLVRLRIDNKALYILFGSWGLCAAVSYVMVSHWLWPDGKLLKAHCFCNS